MANALPMMLTFLVLNPLAVMQVIYQHKVDDDVIVVRKAPEHMVFSMSRHPKCSDETPSCCLSTQEVRECMVSTAWWSCSALSSA